MNIILNKDGTYEIIKNEAKIERSIKNAKYIIIDISTALKGPVCTLIKPKYLSSEKVDCQIDLLLIYAATDCPASDTSTFHYSLPLDSINHRYNIYPLMKQMIDFNYYKCEFDIVDTEITIDNISVLFDGKVAIEINEDIMDEYIDKTFKQLKLITSVLELEDENHIILKNNKWYASSEIPTHFDYILYNIKGNESLYLLTEKQFNRFCLIDSVSIKMYRCYDDITYHKSTTDVFEDEDNYITTTGISNILTSCLYFPQYIELEKNIYNSKMALTISIETPIKIYNLKITEKEFNNNPIELFNIINKLLQL